MAAVDTPLSNVDFEDWIFSVVFQVVYSLRIELGCIVMVAAGYFIGTLARSRTSTGGKANMARAKRSTPNRAAASARAGAPVRTSVEASNPAGVGTESNSKIVRDLGHADAALLREVTWVVPRITQLCRTHVQHAMGSYRAALKAGLDLKVIPAEECHQLFEGLVTASVRINQSYDTLELFRDLRDRGPGIDPALFGSAVKVCTSKHFFTECLAIYDLVAAGGVGQGEGVVAIADKSIWSCLLFCAVETKAHQRCPFFFEQLAFLGTPSPKDYWNMIRSGSARGDWQLLVRLLQEMAAGGVDIDSIVYNTVLACCVSCNQVHHAHRLLEEMADVESVTDVITYNTLMKGYAKAGELDNCFELYELMRNRGIEPSQVTFGILLDGCINENKVDRASEVFNAMSRDGVPMNTVLYTTLIKGFARVGKVDEAMKVYSQMTNEQSMAPDLITFSILIKANCDAGRMEVALELLGATQRQGLQPDEVVFNNLMAGCAKQANAELAKRLYADMVASGIRPSNATFSILIRLYSQCKCLDEAVDMLRTEPYQHGVEVEPRLFTQLLQCCIRARQGRRSVEVYELMSEQSVPSLATNGTLLGMCVKLNMFDTASEFMHIAATRNGRVNQEDAEALLDAAVRKRKPQSAESIAAAMEKLNLSVPQHLMASLGPA